MKALFRMMVLAITLFCSTPVFAQVIPAWNKGELEKSGASLAVNGQKLDRATTLELLRQTGGFGAAALGLGIGLALHF